MSQSMTRNNLVAGSLLAALWAFTAWFFYAPTTPMDSGEIDAYMDKVTTLLETSFVMPEGSGLDARGIEGALADLRAFAERDDGKAIYMVNLMKWRRGDLTFPPGAELADSISTAREADEAYNRRLFWTLLANNSNTAYLASAEPNALNYGTGVGGDADGWGEIGIFRYNSRRDFFNMIASDDYLAAMYLKMVSMGAIAIAPTQPHGLLFNPLPNIPVVVFFLSISVYLAYLLVSLNRRYSPA